MNAVYFVGAGGIGMSALVRYYLSQGIVVGGYDRTACSLTEELRAEGADIHYTDDPDLIPEACRRPESTLVVYTPAIPHDHKELTYFRDHQFRIMKRAEVLGTLTRTMKGLCVAGTHGKTSTSSMAAHLLHQSHVGCNAFLGGITKNYGTNYLLNRESPYVVIEADEFDRSFHHLRPFASVITATDADHLDIYGTEEAYLESFAHFTELITPGGVLVVHTGLKLKPRTAEGVTTYTYSRNEGDFHAENIRKGNGKIIFDFVTPQGVVRDIDLGVPVDINIENAVAAMAVCHLVGATDSDLRNAIATFGGAKRRFDFWIKEDGEHGKVVLDDYAHHPDELRASIRSIKDLYPHRKVTAIFQPHLYSRTRDFAPQFAEALSHADRVILLDIYPAREKPIPGVTSQIIFDRITCPDKMLIDKAQLLHTIETNSFDILLTVGAGDIVTFLPQICEIIKNR